MDESIEIGDFLDEVEARLEKQGGVATFELRELKGLVGAGRLGRRIRDEMQAALSRRGIGCFPNPLPATETQSVRLYIEDSKVARLITAVLTLGEETDQILIKLAHGRGPVDKSAERNAIFKIRRIIDRLQ